MANIGILALQGSVIEHVKKLGCLTDIKVTEVRTKEDIKKVDGIILPGGESTTLGKLLRDFGLFYNLKQRIAEGMPVWGTCAGMILLAKEIVDEPPHLAVMDIKVRRNAYGRQNESFVTTSRIKGVGDEEIKLVFIRAPWIEEVKKNAEPLLVLDGKIVAARQGNMLVTSFHPELTDSASVHKYFANIVKKALCGQK